MIHTDRFERIHGQSPADDITGIVRIEWSTALGRGPFVHSLNVFGYSDLMAKARKFKRDMEDYTNDSVRVYILP